MTAIRLMVSDVDGTLVDPDKRVTDATVAAVARLGDADVAFTIISARPASGMMPIAQRLAIDLPMAAFNGGRIFRRDGELLFHATIDADVARGVTALADETTADTWIFSDDRWYASDPHGPHSDSERVTADQEPLSIDDRSALLDRADKITFVSDDEAVLRALAQQAQEAFGAQATIVQSQTYYLDVTALTANKGDGIARMAEALSVPLDAVAAIGDQANDLPMLARAGLAIAMGNAPDAVRAAAGHVVRGNDADGVADAIDRLVIPAAMAPA